MRRDIWYREELQALLALVENRIARTATTNTTELVALGGLHAKLETALLEAPSALTSAHTKGATA